MPPLSSPGNVQPTIWLKNLPKPCQPIQFFAQRPVESDVHATERPRPYCHWARRGSSRAVTRTVWAAGLAVVPLYPSSCGIPPSIPRRMGEDEVRIGKNASSTICWPETCCVSFRKMSGIEAGLAAL